MQLRYEGVEKAQFFKCSHNLHMKIITSGF